ncbi:MAG: hypothetical protein U0234_33435 [Sandaracinus sp.]
MRTFFFACVLALPLLAAGCLRTKFDLCTQATPDPACSVDGGDTGVADAGTDGGTTTDAGASIDAGVDAP